MAPNGGEDARKESARQAENAAAHRRILEAQAQAQAQAQAPDREMLRRMAELRRRIEELSMGNDRLMAEIQKKW